MALSTAGRLLALVGSGSLALALQMPADGAGATFTKITKPSGGTTYLDQGGTPTIQVAGTASSGVTGVDVYCLGGPQGHVSAAQVGTDVPVTSGRFAWTASVPHIDNNVCRLRALPRGTNVNGDLSAFSGPIVHMDRLTRLTQGSATFDFDLVAGSGSGVMEVTSAGNCGDALMGSVPEDLGSPFASQGCVATLGPPGVAGSPAPLRVDGQVVQLPFSLLNADDSALHLTVHVAKNGGLIWKESAPLMRCVGTGSCGTLAATGVTFTRRGDFTASGHQIRLRDTFASTDGRAHRVRTVYGMQWSPPATGALGFAFPGGKGGFRASVKGEVVKGFPKRAATFLVRSDRFADEGDPMAATRAVTWSRPPDRIAFSTSDASVFGLRYSLRVPKKGTAHLGLTDSDAVRTSSARALGRGAVAGVMPSPTITTPARGAVVVGRRTVVKGVLRAGVNGLPVSLRVNGHLATITAKSATRATYKVVFSESGGKHRLTAVAKDAGGNARSTSITVRNK